MKPLLLVALLAAPAVYCQYPGQYPPGQYPPGRDPGGLSVPRRGKTTSVDQKSVESHILRGMIRTIDAKSLEIEAEDERMITVQIGDATKKPDGLVIGDKVEIDASQDDKGAFTAIIIKKTGSARAAAVTNAEPGSSEPPENTRPSTAMATPVPLDPDDEGGPPKLKRGVPKPRKQPAPSAQTEIAKNESPATPGTEPQPLTVGATLPPTVPADTGRNALIEKAREAAEEFLTGLPNYVCQQFTTRYVSEGHKADWHAQDVVSADVVYEKGKESYRNIAINGKAAKKNIEETGAWSTGEFGTVLADLFSPATAAEFKYAGNRTILRRAAALYDFSVDHPHSHWKISVPGQAIMPAFRGSVWISKDNGRVLRIEMQAVKIPVEFPDDTTEMAVDYDYASLGTDKYLLPVKAEILSCQRGTSMCQRNVIEFRNYHRYAGESTITFH